MTDRLNRLEVELSGMQPCELPAPLTERIGSSLRGIDAPVSPWPDRCLLSAMGAGALAACVIVTILLRLPRAPESSDMSLAAANTMPFKTDMSRRDDSPLVLARGNAAWIDDWK